MRTVKLIQFTDVPDEGIAFYPDQDKFYKVVDMEDTYYHEYENDDGETNEDAYDSVLIVGSISTRPDGSLRKINRSVIKDNAEYNLLTIELEDTSTLFK